ncbi:tripartite motif-containing protein 3-like [Branchiostoma floridae]|uniref:Tripartite motif-containing protein 3-like n=1 Tax=Branchiostoma floridae TaxID=7739 RepID=A0A9J7HHE1_BRAFL|nr:tripartite motif-containing protein 3-like [Branchiostoma floridae]
MGEKPPGETLQEYRGEKPPGETLQEYRGEKPPGGWSAQVEKADSATQTHLTDPVGTTGIPGGVGDKVEADPTVKEEDGKTPRQDSGSGSDGKEVVFATEAPEQERHTAGTKVAASGRTGDMEQRVIAFVVPGRGDKDMRPHDVCMDGNGTLWVLGRGKKADHVVQYSTDGTAMTRFDIKNSSYYRGIAVDIRTNHILVTDPDRGAVQVFRPDGSLVRTVRHSRVGMTRPRFITVDGEGNFLVSDWGNHFVYVYDESGEFLFQFGSHGSGEGQLKFPRGICTDRAGNIIVADHGNERVQIFTRPREFVRTVRTGFWPEGLAVGPEGQLVVTNVTGTVTVYPNY